MKINTSLIWALFLFASLVLFKEEIKPLFSTMEEVTVLDKVKLNLNMHDIEQLKKAETEYTNKIKALERKISEQSTSSSKIELLLKQLNNDIVGCEEAKNNLASFSKISSAFTRMNIQILKDAEFLRKTKFVVMDTK